MKEKNPLFADKKILVVEDQEFMRDMVVQILSRLGFATILEAPEGEQAIAIGAEEAPDAVVCDINMKPVNGIEFIKRVRSGENGLVNDLPIVFLTNDAQEETVLAAREYRANAFIVKPVTVRSLEAKLTQIFGG